MSRGLPDWLPNGLPNGLLPQLVARGKPNLYDADRPLSEHLPGGSNPQDRGPVGTPGTRR